MLSVHQSHQKCLKKFPSCRRVTRKQVRRCLTRNSTDQCQISSSNLLTPYREQPPSTQIVVAYPRLALPETKRTNYAPTRFFGQQAQVSQGLVMQIKKSCRTKVYGGGDLELVKIARESASSRPKLCGSYKNAPKILPVHCSVLALVGRRPWSELSLPLANLPVFLLILVHNINSSALRWLVDDRAALHRRQICHK